MKTFFKFLLQNKLYTAIEAFGLSVALGFVLLLVSYSKTEFNVGNNLPNSNNIYACGTGDFIGMTLGTAPELFPSIPEIKEWTRIVNMGDADIMVGDNYYKVKNTAIDQNFFRFFGYQVSGNALVGKDDVIISSSFARKAFKEEDPVGKTIRYNKSNLRVTAIAQDFGPEDLFEKVDIMFNADRMKDQMSWMDNFGPTAIFFTIAQGTSPETVEKKLLDKYCDYWNYYKRDGSDGSFIYGSTITRMNDIYFCNLDVSSPLRHGNKNTVKILSIVALILLVSAIFNYINLTVAQTGKRAKEMAIRQLIGQRQSYILRLYMEEAFIFTAVCFIIGYFIALLFRSVFNRLLSTDIVLVPDTSMMLIILAILITVSFASGLIPALFALRFKPIDVVKGNFRFKSKMVFSRIFILLQNVISAVLIAIAITMTMQIHHLATLPMGYNTKDVIEVWSYSIGFGHEKQQILQQRLKALPQVVEIGIGSNTPMQCGINGLMTDNSEKYSFMKTAYMDSTSFHILGFKVLEQYSDPLPGKTWIDEETKQRYGVTANNNIIGKKNKGDVYDVCGIVANYRSGTAVDTPYSDQHNAIYIMGDENDRYGVQYVKIRGDHSKALAAVKKVCADVAKEIVGMPIDVTATYLDEHLNDSLTENRNTMALVITFMTISIIISTLGLIAMSTYYTGQQRRQIALRKVFGYKTNSVAKWLSLNFFKLTVTSVVIAVPISIQIIRHYLEGFYYSIAFPWIAILLSVIITVIITLVSTTEQTIQAALKNPVKTLKQND
ncbi:MAG: FtsX-like permease family protein [Phocaeicola sp.]|uniref:ABC transporter permease n=1 Tax=Phocaeicola TaxID=909656 RepID=UPI00234E5E42|nr:ABC transporter permease [Phocaeicola oris]MCE2615663.1 FtsX-like permease family protein [Phocaeicola oris]